MAPRLIARKSSLRIDIIRPRRLKVAAKGKRRVKPDSADLVSDRAIAPQGPCRELQASPKRQQA
jgi:hypothetical protein